MYDIAFCALSTNMWLNCSRPHSMQCSSWFGKFLSVHIGIESSAPAIPGFPRPIKALCVVPFGMEEGTESDIPGHEFGLIIGQKVAFRFLSSSTRKNDTLGTILDEWDDEVHEISPLQLTLESPEKNASMVPVYLHSKISDIGTLELWCIGKNSKQKWKLEFNVRENNTNP